MRRREALTSRPVPEPSPAQGGRHAEASAIAGRPSGDGRLRVETVPDGERASPKAVVLGSRDGTAEPDAEALRTRLGGVPASG